MQTVEWNAPVSSLQCMCTFHVVPSFSPSYSKATTSAWVCHRGGLCTQHRVTLVVLVWDKVVRVRVRQGALLLCGSTKRVPSAKEWALSQHGETVHAVSQRPSSTALHSNCTALCCTANITDASNDPLVYNVVSDKELLQNPMTVQAIPR